jgi:hypothetical protein
MYNKFFYSQQKVLLIIVIVGVGLAWHGNAKASDVYDVPSGSEASQTQKTMVEQATLQQIKHQVEVKAMELRALGCTDQEIIAEFEAALANHANVSEATAAAASRTLDLVLISLGLIGLDYWNEYGWEDEEDWDQPDEGQASTVTNGGHTMAVEEG